MSPCPYFFSINNFDLKLKSTIKLLQSLCRVRCAGSHVNAQYCGRLRQCRCHSDTNGNGTTNSTSYYRAEPGVQRLFLFMWVLIWLRMNFTITQNFGAVMVPSTPRHSLPMCGHSLSNDTLSGHSLSNDTLSGHSLSNDTISGHSLSNDTIFGHVMLHLPGFLMPCIALSSVTRMRPLGERWCSIFPYLNTLVCWYK